MRTCPGCGLREHRQIVNGRELVNLEPVTGCCLPCLVKRSRGVKPMPDPDYDWRRIAAEGRDE